MNTPKKTVPFVTFADCIAREMAPADARASEALARLPYAVECQIKMRAFAEFQRAHNFDGAVEALLPSPLPRGYRTTSKRRVWYKQNQAALVLSQWRPEYAPLQTSQLEPELHGVIYSWLAGQLNAKHYLPLVRSLNYCIIRGSYERCGVIFNVNRVDATIVRKLKTLAAALAEVEKRVISAFMYVDESASDYYLESARPLHGVAFKKLFGPEQLDLSVNGIRMLYPPTVFSQVNESILPAFLGRVQELLRLDASTRLIDLYCGYGLFSLTALPLVKAVIGMELEGPSVAAANANAKYLYPQRNWRFLAVSVTPDAIRKQLPAPDENDAILLDPPRHGTLPGVIQALAERRAKRVLQIFCGTDEIPRAIQEWRQNGYVPAQIAPLDLFPGSPNLETLILFTSEETARPEKVTVRRGVTVMRQSK